MPDHGLRVALERLGLKQTELAELLSVSPRTVSIWATGAAALPGPVAAYLRVVQSLAPAQLSLELGRLDGRQRMLDEGIYSLNYRAEIAGQADADDGLAVLRNGRILGSDRWGGVFTGSYLFDPATTSNTVHIRMQIPPGGRLISGYTAGPKGSTLEFVASLERAAPVSTTVVDVAGQPVEVQLTYLGPLPN